MQNNPNKCTVLLTFDFDAESLWAGEKFETPTYQSRGEYGARVGVPRILSLLDQYDICATFFIPGIIVKKYSNIVKEIHEKGHEIGHHGYLHQSPSRLELKEERQALEQGIEAIETVTGQKPKGYRSPSWDLSQNSIRLFREYDFLYDSSMMGDDFQLYPISLDGKKTELIEIPVSWELDDAPYFLFNFSPYRVGLSSPSHVYEIWAAEFDGAYVNEGTFTLTMHPQIIGRYHRILMLEKLIQYIKGHARVEFTTCAEAAGQWLKQR